MGWRDFRVYLTKTHLQAITKYRIEEYIEGSYLIEGHL